MYSHPEMEDDRKLRDRSCSERIFEEQRSLVSDMPEIHLGAMP